MRALWVTQSGTAPTISILNFPCNVPGTGCNDTLYPGPPSCGCSLPLKSDAHTDSCKNCVSSYYPQQMQPDVEPVSEHQRNKKNCIPLQPSQWRSYKAHVFWHAGDPTSVTAKTTLQHMFCQQFNVSPCVMDITAPNDKLHVFENLGFNIPRDKFASFVPWLMQRRIGLVGSGFDFDVAVHPDTGCIDVDVALSLYGGTPYAFNTNSLVSGQSSSVGDIVTGVDVFDAVATSNKWAYTCSVDDTELCTTPYAPNTTCTDAINAPGFHVHLFFVNNNEDSVNAKTTFDKIFASAFNLPPAGTEVCEDTKGHEQQQNRLCWLTGPDGKESPTPQTHAGSSFVIGTHSVYIPKSNMTNVVSWLMMYMNGDYGIGTSLDALIHPLCGCNYADHKQFSMRIGSYWPNNQYGITMEGGYPYALQHAPETDAKSYNYSPVPVESNCSSAPYNEYRLHLLYNPTQPSSVDAKEMMLQSITGNFTSAGVGVVGDVVDAYKRSDVPFLTSEVELRVAASVLVDVVAWVMEFRTSFGADIDTVLAPVSGCVYGDYIRRSIYTGNRWSFNKYALTANLASNAPSVLTYVGNNKHQQQHHRSTCVPTWKAAILYVMWAQNNMYSTTAVKWFTGAFSERFRVASQLCNSSYPDPEPDYGNQLCMMHQVTDAYNVEGDALTVAHVGIWTPRGMLGDILPWVMENKAANIDSGYELDVLLVPMTGKTDADYGASGFRGGIQWKTNHHALHNNNIDA